MKRTNYWVSFNHKWFIKNQKWILKFLNWPLVKIWFRHKMKLKNVSALYDDQGKEVINPGLLSTHKICKITPEGIHYNPRMDRNGKILVTFRIWPNWEYSKNIYHALKWVWWTLHFLDWLFLERFEKLGIPNFGFTSFGPLYSSANDASPVDGYVERGATESWATMRAATANTTNSGGNPNIITGFFTAGSGNNYGDWYRSIYGYDTSGIGTGNQVDDATFTGQSNEKGDSFGIDDSFHLVGKTPASASSLATGDFDISGWTLTAYTSGKALSAITVNVDFTMSLNASGIAHINVTGNTFFGGIMGRDKDNNEPTWAASKNNYLGIKGSEQANKHHLDGNYSVPSGPTNLKTFNGLAKASIKTINGVAIANVKSINGLS